MVGGFLLLIMMSTFMMRVLLPAIGAQPPQVRPTPTMHADLAEYLFWAIPVSWGSAAFGEELLARGFILNRIARIIGSSKIGSSKTGSSKTPAVLAAVFLQAAIFGAFHIHQGIGGALMTGAAGLILGLVWLGGGRNLWACFLLHGLIDFLAANGL